MTNALRLILGDQLTHNLTMLQEADKNHDVIMLCEVLEEATYVKHHKQKIAFIFSAMRHFAAELTTQGYHVHYSKLDAKDNTGSFDTEVERAIQLYQPEKLMLTEPGEYRIAMKFSAWKTKFQLPIKVYPDNRFFCSRVDFKRWAGAKEHLRMEYFYRDMRRREQILLKADGTPIGGQWNFDKENRKPIKEKMTFPKRKTFQFDDITQEVLALVEKRFADHFGDLKTFHWAVTRKEALLHLNEFIKYSLPHFGDYQDAMQVDEPYLYHSIISAYINIGLLLPREVCHDAETAYQKGLVSLNSAEGFIRQILGWREYVRGIYWLKMPDYAEKNFLNAKRELPWFYWDGNTDMNCLKQAIQQTQQYAYSHHIQRLMVTGNFALLAGILPAAVCEWYLLVYADAYEWVELPNTLGMALYGDGGLLGSKPYAASGKYIHKMSNYCESCRFNPNETTGENACPFNSLYWHFVARNKNLLQHNQRMTYVYATWNKMAKEKQEAIWNQAEAFLEGLE